MLAIIHKHLGVPDKRIITIPKFLYRLGMKSIINEYKEKGLEPGLDPIGLVEIMTRQAFIDKRTIVEELGVEGDDIDRAIGESVRLCMEVLDGKQQTISMKGE